MNKKTLLLATALSLPLTVFARQGMEGHEALPHHRLERLEKELQLSPEQKAKLEVIFKEQHDKFQAIHDESHSRIKEVLSPEQITKWEKMKQQQQEKRREKMQQRQPTSQ